MPEPNVTINIRAVIDSFEKGMAKVISTMNRVRASMQHIADFSKKILIGGGASLGLLTKLATEDEAAQLRLMSALTASGQAANVWGTELDLAAKRIQNLTVVDDEAAKGLFVYAINLGIAADKVEGLTKQSIGLAKALGMDVNSAMKSMVLAMNGQFTILQRYLPALRDNISNNEKLAIVMSLAARGFQQAQDETQTFGGALRQLKNLLSDVGEALGGVILPDLKAYVQTLKDGIPQLQAWLAVNQSAVVSWGKTIGISAGVVFGLSSILKVLTSLGTVGTAFVVTGGLVAKAIHEIVMALTAAAESETSVNRLINQLGKAADGFSELSAARDKFNKAGTDKDKLSATVEQINAIDKLIASEKERAGTFDRREFGDFVGDLTGGFFGNSARTAGKANVEKNLERLFKQRGALVEQSKGLAGASEAKAIVDEEEQKRQDEITKTIDKLSEQANALGLTDRQLEIYKLTVKGATQDQIEYADSLLATVEAYNKTQEAIQRTTKDEAESRSQSLTLVNRLRDEIDLLMNKTTQDEIDLFNLQNLDDTEAGMQRIANLRRLVQERNDAQSEAAFQRAIVARRAEAESLKESLLTDQERYDMEMSRIGILERAGELDTDFATRARKAATDRLQGATGDFQARFESGIEMFRRIQESAATGRSNPQVQIANNTSKLATNATQTLKETQRSNKLLEEIRDKGGTNVAVYGE
jgi:hypothetical protein